MKNKKSQKMEEDSKKSTLSENDYISIWLESWLYLGHFLSNLFTKSSQKIEEKMPENKERKAKNKPLYPREVVKRALFYKITALILQDHNLISEAGHSKADLDLTKLMVRASKALDIGVHDHIAHNDFYSFKSKLLIA